MIPTKISREGEQQELRPWGALYFEGRLCRLLSGTFSEVEPIT